ncbi:hypothetical protein ACWPKO_09245 [Coraliomargarita sp. W4R53]
MEALSQAQSAPDRSQMTDRAYGRVDALLRAYGFSHSVVRSQYCLRILEQALQELSPAGDSLETLAARITLNRIKVGVEKIMTDVGVSIESVKPEDFYLALQAAGIPQNAPEIILAKDVPDDAQLQQIRLHYESQAKPTLRRISMGAPSLRFDTIDEMTGSTERFLQKYPKLVPLLKLILISATFYLVYIFAK